MATIHEITLPDLGLDGFATTLSVWLVPVGSDVMGGDRVVEIHAGDVIVDLSAPVTGTLVEIRAQEDDVVHAGQVLGAVRAGS